MKRSIFGFFVVILLMTSCKSDESSDSGEKRCFYMGFTPWPYGATPEAVEDTYDRINANGDIIAHHLMSGMPWQEALDGTSYHPDVEQDITERLTYTESGKVIYLAIDPLNDSRDGLAPYWGDEQPGWDAKSFNDPDVINAFIHFSLDMISRFNPVYFNYASEISDLILNDAGKYDDFQGFAQEVYTTIKSAYPDLIILVSIAFQDPGSADMETVKTEIAVIDGYYDMLGMSIYPYAFYSHEDKGDPENLPVNWFKQVSEITGNNKPIAVTETAWIAEDLTLGSPTPYYSESSDPQKQNNYLLKLFNEASDLNAYFIIWFSIVDYDTLWEESLKDDVSKIWRDTGLYDENLLARPALSTWQDWLHRIYE
jgi:hypothetical protein